MLAVLLLGVSSIAMAARRGANKARRGSLDCTSAGAGFFCLNELKYAWCNGDDLSAAPTEWKCQDGTICKCGETQSEYGPCAWAFEEVNGTCTGYAGAVLRDYSAHPRTLSGVYQREPSAHLPFSLHFNSSMWQEQLQHLLGLSFYDQSDLRFSNTERSYHCSLHQQAAYDCNPTQLWIGKPDTPVTVHGKKWYLRLPDATTALYLAFAMDHYGVFVLSNHANGHPQARSHMHMRMCGGTFFFETQTGTPRCFWR